MAREDLLKEDMLKEDLLKEDLLKEYLLKEDLLKEDLLKEDLVKEDLLQLRTKCFQISWVIWSRNHIFSCGSGQAPQYFPLLFKIDFTYPLNLILGISLSLWAATAASYCPSRAGELPKNNKKNLSAWWDGKFCRDIYGEIAITSDYFRNHCSLCTSLTSPIVFSK